MSKSRLIKPINFHDHFMGVERAQQTQALSELNDSWGAYDVFVLQLPVATGKSKLSEAVVRAANSKLGLASSGVAVVNNNLLLEQVLRDVKGFRTLRAKRHYQCHEGGSCEARAKRCGGHCKSYSGSYYASDACGYLADLRGARSAGRLVVNQHIYLAHKLYRPVVVFDEAHTLQAHIQEMGVKRLWRSTYGWRKPFASMDDVREWLDDPRTPRDELTEQLQLILDGELRGYTIWLGEEELRGRETELIKLIPLDVRSTAGVMWPGAVQKLVLMSATISPIDIHALGLDKRRVKYIETGSPIPPTQRPFVEHPVADLSWKGRAGGVGADKLAAFVLDELLPNHVGERGLIHVPYALGAELQARLRGHPRLIFHTRAERAVIVNAWLAGDYARDSVLVGSGLHEGIDLAGDAARFQVLTATPRRSVADPGLLWLAENDPQQYEWLTIREIAQAYGRVCRAPDDYGVTIAVDSSVQRELRSPQVPAWLTEARVLT